MANGLPPGSNARLRKLYAEAQANTEALARVLKLLGDDAQESSERRIDTILGDAIKLDEARRAPSRRPPTRVKYERSSPADTERRSVAIRQFLTRRPLARMAEIYGALQKDDPRLPNMQAISKIVNGMKDVQRVGERQHSRYRLRTVAKHSSKPAAKAKAGAYHRLSPAAKEHKAEYERRRRASMRAATKATGQRPSAGYNGSTDEKARIIVGLVRDAPGGIIITKDLVPLARAAGVTSMTGMANYATQGFLRRTRATKSGKEAWRFLRMPPEPTAATPATPSETAE